MNRSDSCSNCARGIKVNINKDILCRINGIVSKDFLCSRYLKLARSSAEDKPKCIQCEFFIPVGSESQERESNGYCQLFTVRCYNGQEKSVCSKFARKAERNIS